MTIALGLVSEHAHASPDGGSALKDEALLGSGALVFALAYAPVCATMQREMCIPVVGHHLYLDRTSRERHPGQTMMLYPVLAAVSVVQLAGTGMMAFGAFQMIRGERPRRPSLGLVPVVTSQHGGLSIAGEF